MINKIIKVLTFAVQILVVIIFVVISIPKDSNDKLSLITNNIDSTKRGSNDSLLFVSDALVDEVLPVEEEIKEEVVTYAEKIMNADLDKVMSYEAVDTFVGTLTAYGPDCTGCRSGKTSTGYRVAEVVDGMVQPAFTLTYVDKEYGEVRILAAAHAKFPKGSVIRVSNASYYDNPFIGIVIDTGYTMRKAWKNGNIWMDLLFTSEESNEVKNFGIDKTVTFEVLRYGY